MLSQEQVWAAMLAIAGTIVGAVTYLIKPVMDASRERQKLLESDNREVVQLQKDFIKTATESSMQNAQTNAKQAADMTSQTVAMAAMMDGCRTIANKTDQIHLALSEFVHVGRLLIKQLADAEDRQVAQRHLTEIVTILGHRH